MQISEQAFLSEDPSEEMPLEPVPLSVNQRRRLPMAVHPNAATDAAAAAPALVEQTRVQVSAETMPALRALVAAFNGQCQFGHPIVQPPRVQQLQVRLLSVFEPIRHLSAAMLADGRAIVAAARVRPPQCAHGHPKTPPVPPVRWVPRPPLRCRFGQRLLDSNMNRPIQPIIGPLRQIPTRGLSAFEPLPELVRTHVTHIRVASPSRGRPMRAVEPRRRASSVPLRDDRSSPRIFCTCDRGPAAGRAPVPCRHCLHILGRGRFEGLGSLGLAPPPPPHGWPEL